MIKKLTKYKTIISSVFPRLALLIILTIVLFLVASSFTQMLFFNKFDEQNVINFYCSFNELPFETKKVLSNITGEEITLVTITFNNETQSVYYLNFTSEEIKSVGTFENQGQLFLTTGASELESGEIYVISGNFTSFYQYGTKEKTPVLTIDDYRKPNLLDQFITKNEFLLAHILIVFVILTALCFLSVIGSILWIFMERDVSKK